MHGLFNEQSQFSVQNVRSQESLKSECYSTQIYHYIDALIKQPQASFTPQQLKEIYELYFDIVNMYVQFVPVD